MILIDVHAHIAPDTIAEAVARTMESHDMKLVGGFITVSGLRAAMKRGAVMASVVFCIAEKPSVVRPANDFLMATSDNRQLIGLGTLHPNYEKPEEEIERLRQAGIKGIKWNSLIQDFYPDEERMLRLYRRLGKDMVAFIHAGGPQATPERLARVLDAFPQMKVVLPHFGGQFALEEAKRYILGRRNVYLDTSWPPTVAALDKAVVVDIIRRHGADRVLFGSDYPTADPAAEAKFLLELPIPVADKERILYQNAQELFSIPLPKGLKVPRFPDEKPR